ncbi:MAG: aspartate-semialdehyde dehydrogenase [Chlamydiales bacterium]
MMGQEFHFREKIPVAILGAMGIIGQTLTALLESHPWFKIESLCESDEHVGKRYGDCIKWKIDKPLPLSLLDAELKPCTPDISSSIIFSCLESPVSNEIEEEFGRAGYLIISLIKNHRQHSSVPIIVPEVNHGHLSLLPKDTGIGALIASPNSIVTGLTMTLKPLYDHFGIDSLHCVSLQALSGAGSPGLAALDIHDNVIPFIEHEEERILFETQNVLGSLRNEDVHPASFSFDIQVARIPVKKGHMGYVRLNLTKNASFKELIDIWNHYRSKVQSMQLYSAPDRPILFKEDKDYPQHIRDLSTMSVSVGQLKALNEKTFSYVFLVDNLIRGTAGNALLIAELLLKEGRIFW